MPPTPHLRSTSLYASHGLAASLLPLAYDHSAHWAVRVAAIAGTVTLAVSHYACRTLRQIGPAPLTAAAIGLTLCDFAKKLSRRLAPAASASTDPNAPKH